MKHLTAAILLIIQTVSFSQLTTKVEFGTPSKSKSQVILKEIVKVYDNSTYTVQYHNIANNMAKKSSYSTITIEKFNKDLQIIQTKTHKLKLNKKNMHYVKLYSENEKLILISMFKNKKQKMYELYYQSINTETLELNNNLTKVLSSKAAKMFGQHYYIDLENFTIVSSPNEKIKMVISKLPAKKIKIDVFTNWDNLIYSLDNIDESKEILLDNKGNIHLTRKNPTLQGSYTISSIINNGSSTKSISLKYDNKILTSNKIALTNSGNLISCGFYNSNSSQFPGIYSIFINCAENKISSSNFKELKEDELLNAMSSNKINRTKKKLAKGHSLLMNSPKNNYKIMDLSQNKDGNIVFIAEHQIIPKKEYFEIVEIYGDLIIAQLDKQGSFNTINSIAKDQRQSIFGSTSSFKYINVKNTICILFNDHIKNKNLLDKGQPEPVESRFNKGVFSMVTINNAGVARKNTIFLNKVHKLRFKPRKSVILPNNQLLMYGGNTLGRISIQ